MILLLIPLLLGWALLTEDNMINILYYLLKFVYFLLDIILFPINYLLESFMPNISDGISNVISMLDFAWTYMVWLVNLIPIPQFALTLIVTYGLAAFTLTMALWVIKLPFKWKKNVD